MNANVRQSMLLPQSAVNSLSLHSSAVSPGLISIEDFTQRVRPADVKVWIAKFVKKYLGASEYVIEIEIGQGWDVLCQSRKTFNEF